MKNKVSVVFFTFKRAIILHSALTSLIKCSGHIIEYPINIIYHYDKDHDASYRLLKKDLKNKIIIHKRKNKVLSKFSYYY